MSKANGYILVNTFNSTYDETPYIAIYGKKLSCLEYNQRSNVDLKDMRFIQEYLYSSKSAAQAQVTKSINKARKHHPDTIELADDTWDILEVKDGRIVI